MCVHCRSIRWRCPHRKLFHLVRNRSRRSRESALGPRTQCQARAPSITIDNSRQGWRHDPTASRPSSLDSAAVSGMSQSIKPRAMRTCRISCAPFSCVCECLVWWLSRLSMVHQTKRMQSWSDGEVSHENSHWNFKLFSMSWCCKEKKRERFSN